MIRLGDQVLVTEIVTQPALTSGPPHAAFEAAAERATTGAPNYDVSATGDSVLVVRPLEGDAGPPQVQLVLNWFEDLRRLTAAK